MKTKILSSVLSKEIMMFIELKQLNGYDYNTPSSYLVRFDCFLEKREYDKDYLTEEIMLQFLSEISYLHARGKQNYYGTLHLFSIWLHARKTKSFVLDGKSTYKKALSRQAFIYSTEQISDFLQKCQNIPPSTELISGMYCTLFCLLYTTGIRINEALSLNCNDYICENQLLHIKKGKFKKERYVVLSGTMNNRLKEYLNLRKNTNSIGEEEPLFIGKQKRRLIYNSVHIVFHKTLSAINIPHMAGVKPRIHDFRHSFAVHCLTKWYRNGGDIYSKLPALSTYMGHVNISSTQVYLQSTSELRKLTEHKFHEFYYNGIKES